MTRTLLVWPFFPPDRGAGSLRGAAFARALRDRGADVHVLTPSKGRGPAEGAPSRPEDVPVHEAPLFQDPTDLLRWPMARRRVGALLDDLEPDVVLASTPPPTVGWQVAGPVRSRGIPLAVDVRDLFSLFMDVSHGPKARYRVSDRIEARLYRAADAVLPTTPTMGEILRDRYGVPGPRLRLTPNGADAERYGEPEGDPDVDAIYLGAFGPGRRGRDLLEALREVRSRRPDARFALVGWSPGGYVEDLRDLWDEPPLDEALDLEPPVPPTEVPAWLARARLGAVTLPDDPAYRAQVPRKTYDYLAAGVPPVALGPADADLAELVDGAGRYATDPAGFVEATLALLEDGGERGKLAAAARDRGRGFHLPALAAGAWDDVLAPLAAGGEPDDGFEAPDLEVW